MKLRIEKQTLRFRLSPADLKILGSTGSLAQSLQITYDSKLTYGIEAANESRFVLESRPQEIKIRVPQGHLTTWLKSQEIEWRFQIDPLDIFIEKDLKPT